MSRGDLLLLHKYLTEFYFTDSTRYGIIFFKIMNLIKLSQISTMRLNNNELLNKLILYKYKLKYCNHNYSVVHVSVVSMLYQVVLLRFSVLH